MSSLAYLSETLGIKTDALALIGTTVPYKENDSYYFAYNHEKECGIITILEKLQILFNKNYYEDVFICIKLLRDMRPDDVWLKNAEANYLARLGFIKEASALMREVLAVKIYAPEFFSTLCFISAYLGNLKNLEKFRNVYRTAFNSICPYFKDRPRNNVEEHDFKSLSTLDLEKLLEQGFRRTDDTISRNICSSCNECKQLRILCKEFTLSDSLKRIMKNNSDLTVKYLDKSEPTNEKADLLSIYLTERHNFAPYDMNDELKLLLLSSEQTQEIDIYLEDKIISVAIIDKAGKSLYATSSFYNAEEDKRSLGMFNIIQMILFGKEKGFDYLYMGENISLIKNMSYKTRFKPYEYLVGNEWVRGEIK